MRDLRERTEEYALRVIRLYRRLPRGEEARTLGIQLLKGGTSVGAHYREARRVRSTKEFVSKMGVALQELDESDYWLSLLASSEIVPPHLLAPLRQETDELIAIFVTALNTARRPD